MSLRMLYDRTVHPITVGYSLLEEQDFQLVTRNLVASILRATCTVEILPIELHMTSISYII